MEEEPNYSIQPYKEKLKCKGLTNFSLAAQRCLKRINFKNHENNFEFQFRNNKTLKVPDIIAEFFSPVVSDMKAKDSGIWFLKIDEDATDEIINKLEMLLHGQSVSVAGFQDPLVNIFMLLQNPELLESLPFEINNKNLMEILNTKAKIKANTDKEIEYGAIHFEEIKYQNFTLEQFMLFLGNDNLKLTNEKSLLDFIYEKIQQNSKYFVLIKFIRCEFLEEELSKFKFTSIVDSIPSDKIGVIWPAINTSLRVKPSEELFFKRFLGFQYNGINKFNGIFNYLTELSHGNIISNGTINVTSSLRSTDKYYPLENIVQQNGDFCTGNYENSFILFDFKEKKVFLTAYSLKSNSHNLSVYFLKNWQLQGSNDESNWITLDQRENDRSLKGFLNEEIFEIKMKKGWFRYVKLMINKVNWGNSFDLALNRIEFFGQIFDKDFS